MNYLSHLTHKIYISIIFNLLFFSNLSYGQGLTILEIQKFHIADIEDKYRKPTLPQDSLSICILIKIESNDTIFKIKDSEIIRQDSQFVKFQYRMNGELEEREKVKFVTASKVIRIIEYFEDGEIELDSIIETYNSHDLLLNREQFGFEQGKLSYRLSSSYSYNEHNKLVEIARFRCDSLFRLFNVFYDAEGRVKRIEMKNNNLELLTYSERLYNKHIDNNLFEVDFFSSNGQLSKKILLPRYPISKMVITTKKYQKPLPNSSLHSLLTTEYYKPKIKGNGNIVVSSISYRDNKLTNKQELIYDRKGRQIKNSIFDSDNVLKVEFISIYKDRN